MNYQTKCIITALEADINNKDSYEIGVIIGETVKHLANNNVEGCNAQALINGINDGFHKANVKELTCNLDECY